MDQESLKEIERAYTRGYHDAQQNKMFWSALDAFVKELCYAKSFDDLEGDVCDFENYEYNKQKA